MLFQELGKLKRSSIMTSIIMMAVGILMIMCPEQYVSALVATLGVGLPSFILVLLVCYFIDRFKNSHIIENAFSGIRPVTTGLIASAAVFIGQTVFLSLNPVPIAIFCGSVLLVRKWKVSPILIMIGAGIIGALLCG